jgi:SSS family solute:Na+ symporter
VELLTSLICVVSFIFLLSSNLVGLGTITSYLWDIPVRAGIWLAAFIVWAYTIGGGLFSVAYTDVVQCAVGW